MSLYSGVIQAVLLKLLEFGSLASLGGLGGLKDGPINILGILDRIRLFRAGNYLHIALAYHISIVSLIHFNLFPTLTPWPPHSPTPIDLS